MEGVIQQTTEILSFSLTQNYFRLFLSLVIIIMLLRIVWRVEKRLDRFFKLILIGWILVLARHFLYIFEDLEIIGPWKWAKLLEFIPSLLFIWALYVMNSIITRMNREK